MESKTKAGLQSFIAAPLMVLVAFTIASLVFTFIIRDPSPVPVFIIFATIQCTCMILFAFLPGKGRNAARLTSMFLIGTFLVVLAGTLGRTNFQIEGFFFYLLSGTMSGVIVHFAMGKIVGPLLFNRTWCSWGCWTSMVLDLLPYKGNSSWKKGRFSKIRFLYFAIALSVVAGMYFGLKHTIINTVPSKNGMGTVQEMIWFLAGVVMYYIVGISLALAMKDNRAFCKYICPITVFYKAVARFSVLRIEGQSAKCTRCGTCAANCPMAVNIPEYINNDERVKSTECIMCMNCVAGCPQAALTASIGFDMTKKEHLRICDDIPEKVHVRSEGAFEMQHKS